MSEVQRYAIGKVVLCIDYTLRCVPLSAGCLVSNFPAQSIPLTYFTNPRWTIIDQLPDALWRPSLFLLLGIINVGGWAKVPNCDYSLGASFPPRGWASLLDSVYAGIYNTCQHWADVQIYCAITFGLEDLLVCAKFQGTVKFLARHV